MNSQIQSIKRQLSDIVSRMKLPSLQALSVGKAVSLVFLLSLVLYLFSFARSVGWGDSADLALRAADLSFNDFKGTSRDYALFRYFNWILITPLLSWLDPAFLVNFINACMGAAGVAIVAGIAGVIGKGPLAAIVAGLSLAFAHTFWLLSSTAEVYTFNVVLSYGSLLFLLLWYENKRRSCFFASFGLAGLSLSHHASGLVLVVILIVAMLINLRRNQLSALVLLSGLIILASASYFYLVRVLAAASEAHSIIEALGLEGSSNPFYDVNPLREFVKLIFFSLVNFPGLAFAFAMIGMLASFKHRLVKVIPIILWASGFFLTGILSSIPDKFNIYVMAYPSVAILAGIGFSFSSRWLALHFGAAGVPVAVGLLMIIPASLYAVVPSIASRFNTDLSGAREAPMRNNNTYFLWPPKISDAGPSEYARRVYSVLKPGDTLIADYTLWRPLLYYQKLKGRGRDVSLIFVERLLGVGVDQYLDKNISKGRIFLASSSPPSYYQLDRISRRYSLKSDDVIYNVILR